MIINDAEVLIGKTIKDIWIDSEGEYIVFEGDRPYFFFVEGGCCSSTWIHEINGRDALHEAEINNVEVKGIDLPGDIYDRDECEVLESYCLTLITKKGHCDIIYRNESNGYYGGYLTYLDFGSGRYGLDEHEEIENAFKEKKNFNKIDQDQMTFI